MYTLIEKDGVEEKAYIYCFYDFVLLFQSVQGGRQFLKITKFECTYFMGDPKEYFISQNS